MDRQSGKTYGVAFIEVKPKYNGSLNQENINLLSRTTLQGRRLKFSMSSYDELRQRLFSTWTGTFRHGVAIPFVDKRQQEDVNEKDGTSDFFIGQRDLQTILQISRNYKVMLKVKKFYFVLMCQHIGIL